MLNWPAYEGVPLVTSAAYEGAAFVTGAAYGGAAFVTGADMCRTHTACYAHTYTHTHVRLLVHTMYMRTYVNANDQEITLARKTQKGDSRHVVH